MNGNLSYREFWNPEIETMSVEELYERFHRDLMHRQIRYAYEHSEFYRKKYSSVGISQNDLNDIKLEELPFTSKSEIIEDQQQRPPFGSLLAVPIEKLVRIHRTSGYSGRPVFIVLTRNDIEQTLEAGARTFWCAGVRPNDVIVHCLNYCLWIGGLTDHLSLEHTGTTVVPFGVGNSKNLIELILYLKPTGISCTPSYLSRLEELLRDEFNMHPRDLHLKKAILGGEAGLQNQEFRQAIEDKWGIKAIDGNFGVSDVLSAFGSECEFRSGMHFHGQGIIHPELIDPVTEKVLDIRTGQIGELVYTNLNREAQPLIRFRSHDMVEVVGTEKCQCGRASFRFKVLGRSDDMIVVRGINVFPTAISTMIAQFHDILTGEFEIILNTPPPYDYLPIRVEYRHNIPEKVINETIDRLKKVIKEKLSFTAEIAMTPEGSILRTEGKAKRIVRKF